MTPEKTNSINKYGQISQQEVNKIKSSFGEGSIKQVFSKESHNGEFAASEMIASKKIIKFVTSFKTFAIESQDFPINNIKDVMEVIKAKYQIEYVIEHGQNEVANILIKGYKGLDYICTISDEGSEDDHCYTIQSGLARDEVSAKCLNSILHLHLEIINGLHYQSSGETNDKFINITPQMRTLWDEKMLSFSPTKKVKTKSIKEKMQNFELKATSYFEMKKLANLLESEDVIQENGGSVPKMIFVKQKGEAIDPKYSNFLRNLIKNRIEIPLNYNDIESLIEEPGVLFSETRERFPEMDKFLITTSIMPIDFPDKIHPDSAEPFDMYKKKFIDSLSKDLKELAYSEDVVFLVDVLTDSIDIEDEIDFPDSLDCKIINIDPRSLNKISIENAINDALKKYKGVEKIKNHTIQTFLSLKLSRKDISRITQSAITRKIENNILKIKASEKIINDELLHELYQSNPEYRNSFGV